MQNVTMSIHVIGRLAPNPRLGVPQGSSLGGGIQLDNNSALKAGEGANGDIRAGDKRLRQDDSPVRSTRSRSLCDRLS
jgi:hypothetical protein